MKSVALESMGQAKKRTFVPLPLYAFRIPAGFPSPAEDYMEGKLDLNEELIDCAEATFFMRVSGDSMIGAGIMPGGMLVVDRSIEARHGKIVIAVVDGQLTVKRLYDRGGKIQLCSENPKYQPIKVSREQDLQIWGVVTNVITKLN
ncbi:LexA family transcriptional regulator [Kiloniella sp. EL199]|uniref:LexA family protein n=1 Tax=Kiloniella sp. EL199 TaxID=2107581 RepID=UPI000EA0D33D|nr:translesion error-prone DNA polymerase V autoproteolytic subunit [Kiloniella sp. EL199]